MDPSINPGNGAYRILIVGREEALLRTRQAILRGAGYGATALEAGAELPGDAGDADLIILCQSLNEARSMSIRRWLRDEGSKAKVLQMVKRPSDRTDQFCSLDGPAALLAKVAEMLKGERAGRSSSAVRATLCESEMSASAALRPAGPAPFTTLS